MARIRLPAEWEPHQATWLAWPSAADLWLEHLLPARVAFTAFCGAIADPDPKTGSPRGERLEILVPDEEQETQARAWLADIKDCVRFHRIPFGDIWLRDTAPLFIMDEQRKLGSVRFRFNGWGFKYVLEHDDRVAERIASVSDVPSSAVDMVFEGGSIDTDGHGTCLTTRQCLLNRNRNPGLGRKAVERNLNRSLGLSNVLWLGNGLVGDHTDGHVDNIARFVAPGIVVCMEARDADDPNKDVLDRIFRDLSAFRDADKEPFIVIRIPSPGRVEDYEGRVMPASYMNFYIANRAVVVPVYGTRYDGEAVAAIAALFPGRSVVGINGLAMLSGGGAFHCITQQQPKEAA